MTETSHLKVVPFKPRPFVSWSIILGGFDCIACDDTGYAKLADLVDKMSGSIETVDLAYSWSAALRDTEAASEG